MSAIADFAHGFLRIDGTAPHVVGVFDLHQAGGGGVRVDRLDEARDFAPRKDAVFGLDGADDAARKPGHHGKLVVEEVGAGIADHFLAMLGEELDGRWCLPIVPVGTKRGFLAGDFSGPLFQQVDGGIFAIDVVADFGFHHGPKPPHFGRRFQSRYRCVDRSC